MMSRPTPVPAILLLSLVMLVSLSVSYGTQIRVPAFNAELSADAQDVTAGETVRYDITVKNLGLGEDTYDILPDSGMDSSGWSVSYSDMAMNLTVASGAKGIFSVMIQAPADALSGDQQPGGATVQSQTDTSVKQTLSWVTTVVEDTAFEVVVADGPFTAEPEGEVSIPVMVTNLGNGPDTAILSLKDAGDWNYIFEPPTLSLKKDQVEVATLKAAAPANGAAGALTEAYVVINSQKDGDFYLETPLSLEVGKRVQLMADTGGDIEVDAGSTAQTMVTVKNLGNGPEDLAVSVAAPANWSMELPDPFTLDPGEEEELIISMSIPAGELASTYPVIVNITPNNVSRSILGQIMVTVSPFYNLDLTLNTPRVDALPGEVFTYNVTVTNLGNAQDVASISVMGQPLGSTIETSEQKPSLQPGESRDLLISVRTKSSLEPGVRNITIKISSQGHGGIQGEVTPMMVVLDPNSGLGDVQFRVMDEKGFPMALAVVLFNDEEVGNTDADGYFIMEGVEPGKIDVAVKKPGYSNLEFTVEVEADRITDVGELTIKTPEGGESQVSTETDEDGMKQTIILFSVALVVLAAVMFLVVFLKARKRKQQESLPAATDEYQSLYGNRPPGSGGQ